MKRVHPTDKHVGNRLRMRRLMLHKSQSDVANALGLHFSSFKSTRMGRAALARAGCGACAQFYKSR
jgi:hypothetical protein